MSKANKVLLFAYRKGYRVNEEGEVYNPKGDIVTPKLTYSKQVYPTINIWVGGKIDNIRSLPIKIHRLAAYCFYRDQIFEKDIEVRHINGNVYDLSINNIKLGTKSENEKDKKYETIKPGRVKAAKAARESRRLLSDKDIEQIKKLKSEKNSQDKIANIIGVSQATISRLLNKKTYQEIKGLEVVQYDQKTNLLDERTSSS